MVKFGINLSKVNDLHFFEFIALMNDLHKTSFRNVVDLRMLKTKDLKNYSQEQKSEILKQKRAIDYFDNLLGGGKNVRNLRANKN